MDAMPDLHKEGEMSGRGAQMAEDIRKTIRYVEEACRYFEGACRRGALSVEEGRRGNGWRVCGMGTI
jgi:hypothetical protein